MPFHDGPGRWTAAGALYLAGCVMAAALVGLAAAADRAGAADWPTRAVTVVVPFAAGGNTDMMARLGAERLTARFGQSFVVENRPSAGGAVAANQVARAAADGYTLLFSASATLMLTPLVQKVSYDADRDFIPITNMGTGTQVLAVRRDLPVGTFAELIAYAKANPGKLNYASSGIGTPPHLAGELFKTMAGIDIVHVPFREANSALNSVISGATQMSFVIASIAQSQMSGGTVRGLAVTSKQASALVPGVPPVAQAGLPGFEVVGWNGFVAPKATPQRVVARLSDALLAGLGDPELRKRVAAAGYEPAERNTPQEFAAFIAADTAKWLDLVAKTNMKGN